MYQSIHHNIIFFLRILFHQTKPGSCILHHLLSNLDPLFSSSYQTWIQYFPPLTKPGSRILLLLSNLDIVFSSSYQTWIPYSPPLIKPGSRILLLLSNLDHVFSSSYQTWILYSPTLIKPGSRILLLWTWTWTWTMYSSHQTWTPYYPPLIKPGPCILLLLSNLNHVFFSSHQTWTPYSPPLIKPGSCIFLLSFSNHQIEEKSINYSKNITLSLSLYSRTLPLMCASLMVLKWRTRRKMGK